MYINHTWGPVLETTLLIIRMWRNSSIWLNGCGTLLKLSNRLWLKIISLIEIDNFFLINLSQMPNNLSKYLGSLFCHKLFYFARNLIRWCDFKHRTKTNILQSRSSNPSFNWLNTALYHPLYIRRNLKN